MDSKNWGFYDALEKVIKARPIVNPNQSFKRQIEFFQSMRKTPQAQEMLASFSQRWPNKAQVYRWSKENQSVTYFPQPSWVQENSWAELFDAFVHHNLHFWNRYFRFVFEDAGERDANPLLFGEKRVIR